MTLSEAAHVLGNATGLIPSYDDRRPEGCTVCYIRLSTPDLSVAGPIVLLTIPLRFQEGQWTVLSSVTLPIQRDVMNTFNGLLAE